MGRRTVEIRPPGGHPEERRSPRAHHSRAGRAVTPLSEGRRSDAVRLSVRGARVSVTARIKALRTGGGQLGGTAVAAQFETRRTCFRGLRGAARAHTDRVQSKPRSARVTVTALALAVSAQLKTRRTFLWGLRGAARAHTDRVQSKSRCAGGRQLCSSTARVCRSGACCCNQGSGCTCASYPVMKACAVEVGGALAAGECAPGWGGNSGGGGGEGGDGPGRNSGAGGDGRGRGARATAVCCWNMAEKKKPSEDGT